MSKRKPNAVDTYSFACPTCGARMGEWCKGRDKDNAHAARLAKSVKFKKRKKGPQSAHAIPSAFETNRRKH